LVFKTFRHTKKVLTKGQIFFEKPKDIVDLAFKKFQTPQKVPKKAMYLENQKI
jgi:hypothetical protein